MKANPEMLFQSRRNVIVKTGIDRMTTIFIKTNISTPPLLKQTRKRAKELTRLASIYPNVYAEVHIWKPILACK